MIVQKKPPQDEFIAYVIFKMYGDDEFTVPLVLHDNNELIIPIKYYDTHLKADTVYVGQST